MVTTITKIHYVYGSGTHGCLYDYGPNYAATLQDAVDALAMLFNLSLRRQRQLKRGTYLELQSYDGADYCEITECSCTTPWDHEEDPHEARRIREEMELDTDE